MSEEKKSKRGALVGTQLVSAIATGGGGSIFQARVATLYLANMLTGVPSAFGLHGARVESLRIEARYTGAHTDDIYCELRNDKRFYLQLIQCKRGMNASTGDKDFVDGLRGAWRDFLGLEGSPFDRTRDMLVLATAAPATAANQAAKRLCELARASLDLADFLHKLDSRLFDAQHRRTWNAFKEISNDSLVEKYTDGLVFDLLRRLRVDIHDLGTESTQELSLVQGLLASGQPGKSGVQVWNALFSYALDQGITAGTITRATWRAAAQASTREAIDRLSVHNGWGGIAEQFNERASHQLSLISTELPNGVHIPRSQCVASVLSGFDERQLVIMAGGPGVGKSAVVAKLAPLLRESGPLFFFRADELDEPSLAAVQSLHHLPDAVQSLRRILCSGKPTLVIDSLEKALEARNPGALEELLALVRQSKETRLFVTTRSYALNALYSLFLADFSYQVVDVPPLTDAEISAAVAGTSLEHIAVKDGGVREVLRAPYYLRLAFNYIAAGAALPPTSGNDLRLRLWSERIAPGKGLGTGLAARRRAVFDQICYTRTERFSQFVEAPNDAEAVALLVQDGVLAKDATDRVAPAHDVLEDWSLFFRVEREVRGAERDWEALFGKLGSHAGMRRALRAWTTQRSAEGDRDAYDLLETALRQDHTIPQLWRDEIVIGLLRSEQIKELVASFRRSFLLKSASLLQQLSHLLCVACKGPTSIDYSSLKQDAEGTEIALRLGMAAPAGKAWDVVVGLVAEVFPDLPSDSYSWVVQLAEEATSHDETWHQPTQRVLDVFNMAEHFCACNRDAWYGEQSIGRRFYALLCRCAGAAPKRFNAIIEAYLQRLIATSGERDFYAEERLEFLVNFKHCREASFFYPELVWKVFWALYTESDPKLDREFGAMGWEGNFALSNLADHGFFPPSVLQGPFRSLLLYAWPRSVRFVLDLCNHAALSFAKTSRNKVSIIPPEQSPNGRRHIHDFRLWAAYRGHGFTSYVLNAALMALEERLLREAEEQPEIISQVLEIMLELGESSLTTGLVAGILMAHPELITEKLLSIFKCPIFFGDDMARSLEEPTTLAIYGGNDGLDAARQRERAASNRLPHRRQHLEGLLLLLQFNRPDLRDAIYGLLDSHLAAMTGRQVPDVWRMGLKRMDSRGLRLEDPAGDGRSVPLEIANLEPELQQASDRAQARMQRLNRIGAVRTWAAAVTGRFSTAAPETVGRFLSPSEPFEELFRLDTEIEGEEISMLAGLDDELAYALIAKWPTDTSQALQWARTMVLERAAIREENDAWLRRDHTLGELRARTVIIIAAVAPSLPNLDEALINTLTEPAWKLRRAAAMAISEVLRPVQPARADSLTTVLAQYAEALDTTGKRKDRQVRGHSDRARAITVRELGDALRGRRGAERPSPESLAAVKEWTIAFDAARGEMPDTWRVQSLVTLAGFIADQEGGPRTQRYDADHIDFETRRELGDLLAADLMAQPDDSSPLFEALDHCLDKAPELSEWILESVFAEYAKHEFANSAAFWRVWDRATAKVFSDTSLRIQRRDFYSQFHKLLRTLLFCSTPWPATWSDIALFRSRPNFIADCLRAVGDSRAGMESLLQLMVGVGRVSAIPSALTQLRDALERAPVDLFDDKNSLWYAETICRVAVHEHREALIRDVKLRRATLDVLDRLVEAGSSIGFQLRDYLATSSTAAS
jgi:hypothetical protein